MPLAREIYQEGLRLPPILLVKGGKTDERLLAMILANVRTPEERRGDLLAQLMSIKRGEERLREMVARYGLPCVQRNMASLKDYSERMMRAEIERLPHGVFRFEDSLDGENLTIKVAVTIRGRNLWRLYDYIHQHKMPWVMRVDVGRDFAADDEPVVTAIEFAEVKESERDQAL